MSSPGPISTPASAPSSPRVLVMGAGTIGCYLGGLLVAAGLDVAFVGRPRVIQALRSHGLTLTDLNQRRLHVSTAMLNLNETCPPGWAPDVTLLCVKSGATPEAARELQRALPAGSVVLSMQNGVGNARDAQATAPDMDVRAGMVPFNVAELAPGQFHRGTGGALMVHGRATESALRALPQAFTQGGVELQLIESPASMHAVQWGKLLLNLNNPVNALSGRALRAQLLERGYRQCFAALQREALDILDAAGLPVQSMAPVPPRRLIQVLNLPSPLFRLVAARMLKIDAQARSSMADDLKLGRLTEIDALCGEVQRLAASTGRSAPLNSRMRELVMDWPQRARPYSPSELKQALGLR
ncbi:2-dehydropantoate 2-reductase [Roseateles koreensis]|uniref:2-dehydropantoate 2-reductase n=1 Tax=Roseateles koreensis TaxID=2987526 RepID=A0ABT5KMP8_9BURK|nr:2-dehydropantoate 2-reductase [Roseateles koreensis]MDC8783730.1 2-dehydropantoate 2-reductase [Roseateles koreensis]